MSLGSYTHPVDAYFNEDTREYITVKESDLPYFKILKTEEDLAIFREKAGKDIRIITRQYENEQQFFFIGSPKDDPEELIRKAERISLEAKTMSDSFKDAVGVVVFDDQMNQKELFQDFYYNITAHSDWVRQNTLQESLKQYGTSMSEFEKERIGVLLKTDVDEDTINNFIYLPYDLQNALLAALPNKKG